jgi:hypothetical protein
MLAQISSANTTHNSRHHQQAQPYLSGIANNHARYLIGIQNPALSQQLHHATFLDSTMLLDAASMVEKYRHVCVHAHRENGE